MRKRHPARGDDRVDQSCSVVDISEVEILLVSHPKHAHASSDVGLRTAGSRANCLIDLMTDRLSNSVEAFHDRQGKTSLDPAGKE